ncbi:alcohol dehydrogenase catalytic domain-containing protein [Rhizobium johnstonii]|nr:alcohol dehydrogenase catalytic domain-containing protein [Rhizobium johnstonii]
MKAIVFDDFGGPAVLRLAEVPLPDIRPDDLLVKVRAAGVNRADILQREGVYGSQTYGDSSILGLEVAGEVVAVGKSVRDYGVGNRVMGIVGVVHMLNTLVSTAAWQRGSRKVFRSSRRPPSWKAS